MLYEYIFWDWNGTLLDDAHVAFDAVNAMLGARKLNIITFEQYCDYIDVPIIKFYERVLDMSKESMDGIAAEFNSYCESFMPKNPLANGALAPDPRAVFLARHTACRRWQIRLAHQGGIPRALCDGAFLSTPENGKAPAIFRPRSA